MNPKLIQWAGWTLTGLTVVFLLFDASMKLAGSAASIEATGALGFSAVSTRVLGALLLACTALYAIPAASVLGAVLLTAFLGGTVALHWQHGSPVGSHTLFGVYVGLMAWGGLYLRSAPLRALFPIRT